MFSIRTYTNILRIKMQLFLFTRNWIKKIDKAQMPNIALKCRKIKPFLSLVDNSRINNIPVSVLRKDT